MGLLVFCLLVMCLAVESIDPVKMVQILKNKLVMKKKNCSIHRSAIARDVLATDFYPIFERYGVNVPKKCKLHKDRDIFTWIERNKSDAEGLALKCELCGKQFYDQYNFNEHAKRKHSKVFLMQSNAVCLADFCEIFRCDLHEKYPHEIPDAIQCNDKNVKTLRRKCEALMRSCLPDELFHRVYDKLYAAVCSTLTCEKFLHPFKDSVSVFTVVALSIAIPVSLFILAHACLFYFDNMDSVDDDEKFHRAQRARYEARNAEMNARFYAARNRGIESRHRKSYKYSLDEHRSKYRR